MGLAPFWLPLSLPEGTAGSCGSPCFFILLITCSQSDVMWCSFSLGVWRALAVRSQSDQLAWASLLWPEVISIQYIAPGTSNPSPAPSLSLYVLINANQTCSSGSTFMISLCWSLPSSSQCVYMHYGAVEGWSWPQQTDWREVARNSRVGGPNLTVFWRRTITVFLEELRISHLPPPPPSLPFWLFPSQVTLRAATLP